MLPLEVLGIARTIVGAPIEPRALARWSAEELALKSGVGHSTIRRMESADGIPSASVKNVAAVQRALEAAGVEFTNGDAPGVRLRKQR
jgi:transcriptional regulator with XRE-family HTH domain